MVNEESPEESLVITTSRGFSQWLESIQSALAFTTYQAGKLFFLGLKPDGTFAIFERTFARSMGLGVSADGRTLALATQYQIHRFDNVVPEGDLSGDGSDAVFAPHAAWVTGDLDTHEVAWGIDLRP